MQAWRVARIWYLLPEVIKERRVKYDNIESCIFLEAAQAGARQSECIRQSRDVLGAGRQ